ncbi:MAG TPA: hypothetical protein VNT58_12415 [Gaiellaceae bacterium]|nr:hypothetical protein [Gaiellaceae bacterium]
MPPPRGRRDRIAALLAGLTILLVGAAVAAMIVRAPADIVDPISSVLGTQASTTAAATTERATTQSTPAATTPTTTTPTATAPAATTQAEPEAAPAAPAATGRTTVRSRGSAILLADDAELGEFVGARVVARRARVGDVVGNRIFWIGTGSERLLVHLQGPGTRWGVRRGQLVSFTGVLTRTRPGAAAAWGLEANEGRAEQQRQGHHLEVYGPDMRFDCLKACS